MQHTTPTFDLRTVGFFNSLTSEEIQNLSHSITLRPCNKAEVIYHATQAGEETFFILQGQVKLCLSLEDGREVSFEILGPNDFFGEGGLLLTPRHNCTAQAMEQSLLLVMPRQLLLELMEHNGRFSLEIARYLSARLSDFRQRQEMLLHNVNVRFARLLLSLAKRHGTTPSGTGMRINVKLTHQEMANLIGTARETLTLAIGKFRNDGLLAESGRSLIIENLPELERRASQSDL